MERRCALEILNEVSGQEAYSNLAVNRFLEKYPEADSGFVRQLVYGVLENRIYLDYMLSNFIKTPLKKVKLPALNILRMGVYQLFFLDSVPDYAAVNESVELAKKFTKGQVPFVNGVLRNVMRRGMKIPLPDRDQAFSDWLSVKYSYAKWLVEYWLESYGPEVTERLMQAGNEVPPLTIRTNRLKTDRAALAEELSGQGFEVSPGRHSAQALNVQGKHLLSSPLFQKGVFQVQDESSMMAVELLDPQPGQFLIDLCAAPGGKTVYAGELMENRGKILACDLYEHKLTLLSKAAAQHGIENLETRVQDGTVFDPELEGMADRVLCDVPCSGLGVIRRKPEIKYTKRLEDVQALSEIQMKILETGSRYLKPGGVLVYSTCTISPLENEGVTRRFLSMQQGFSCLEQRQLLPCDDGTDGFFLCKIKKNE